MKFNFNVPMFLLSAGIAGMTGWLARLNCPTVPLIGCGLVVLLFAIMTIAPEERT